MRDAQRSALPVILGSSLLLLAPCAWAATYYVATTGNDANACTLSSPCRTIAKGLTKLGAGDTLYIRGGTYGEAIDSNSQTIPTGISWTNAPIIAGYPGETVVLKPGSSQTVVTLNASYIQYVIFDGLILDGAGGYYGISIHSGANHIRFQNGEVRNAFHSGIIQEDIGTGFNQFINLAVHDNGQCYSSSTCPGPPPHGF